MMHYYYGNYPSMMDAGVGFGGGILMLLFWVGVVVLVVMLVRMMRGSDRSEPGTVASVNTAFNILKERYAKGEINKEEFDQKKKDLTE